jgi:hypothetical protein
MYIAFSVRFRELFQALQWFDKVDESSLSRSDLDKFNFQKGYSFLMPKEKEAFI